MAYLGSPFPSTAELMYIRRVDHLEVQVAALEAERDALRADAERWRMLPAFLEDYQVPYLGLSRDIDAAIAARRST